MLWECSDWHAVNMSGKKLNTSDYTAIMRPLNATFQKDTIKYYPSCFRTPPLSHFKNKTVSVIFTLHGLKIAVSCVVFKLTCMYHIHITMRTWNMISNICNSTIKNKLINGVSAVLRLQSLTLCYFLSFLSYNRSKYCRILIKQWLK